MKPVMKPAPKCKCNVAPVRRKGCWPFCPVCYLFWWRTDPDG